MTPGRAVRVAVAAALLAALAPPARANMASPTTPGTAAGEPPEALAGLRIARERLVLDLRPLAQRGGARAVGVEAEYQVVNEGAARRVPLAFTALGQGVEAAQVWLDGEPVAARRQGQAPVPAAWRVARGTPSLDAGEALALETDTLAAAWLAFTLDVPPGRHRIRVAYRVRPASTDGGRHPNRTWQAAYSLAPARFWAGFGVLDVRVELPAGWEAAASLPLRREADALVGQFSGVPGDVLAVSARAPVPAGRMPLRVAALLGALAVFGAAGWGGGRLARRRGWPVRAALPLSLAGGLAGAALFAWLSVRAAGLGDSPAHSYGAFFSTAFVAAPLAAAIGTALAQTVAGRAYRRKVPRAVPR